jgi:hypothetical protein
VFDLNPNEKGIQALYVVVPVLAEPERLLCTPLPLFFIDVCRGPKLLLSLLYGLSLLLLVCGLPIVLVSAAVGAGVGASCWIVCINCGFCSLALEPVASTPQPPFLPTCTVQKSMSSIAGAQLTGR